MSVLALPLRVEQDGRLAVLASDSPGEVAQSVAVLLDTRPGERRCEPEYGLPDPLYVGLTRQAVQGVIDRWEPRAVRVPLDLTGVGLSAQHARVLIGADELADAGAV